MSQVATGLRWVFDKLGLLLLIIVVLVAATYLNDVRKQIETAEETVGALESIREAIESELRSAEDKLEDAKKALAYQIKELADAEEMAAESRKLADECVAELEECGWICQLRDLEGHKKREVACALKVSIADTLEREAEDVRDNPIFRDYTALEERVAEIRRRLDAQEVLISDQIELLSSGVPYRIFRMVKQVFPAAIGVLIGVLLVPLAIRWVFYYVLAPRATQLPPITILPSEDPPEPQQHERSGVSVRLAINQGEELILQPSFIQALDHSSGAKTQWLLNGRLPFASIASGMFLLTRIGHQEHGQNEVVVSSPRNDLEEVGVIELPEGSAMVVQPRSLAGVVKTKEVPLTISSHWRLKSLHAWLTLQLRYLVFHGPCKLIIKGCRGMRLESPAIEGARTIRQSATIGWSANLGYKTVRCETFIPYFRGKEELFSDMFLGEHGKFAYEEMPYWGRQKGALSRGLEGLVDAVLKAFGI